jgi:hypothetical protein
VAEHPEIKASIYLLSFLKCKSLEQFEKMKKEWAKHSTPVSGFQSKVSSRIKRVNISDFLHADGQITSKVNPDMKKFANSLEVLQQNMRLNSVK